MPIFNRIKLKSGEVAEYGRFSLRGVIITILIVTISGGGVGYVLYDQLSALQEIKQGHISSLEDRVDTLSQKYNTLNVSAEEEPAGE